MTKEISLMMLFFLKGLSSPEYLLRTTSTLVITQSLSNSGRVPQALSLRPPKSSRNYLYVVRLAAQPLQLDSKMKSLDSSKTLTEIIDAADTIYNSRIDFYENGNNFPQNIFSDMEASIELRGNNPQCEFGVAWPP